MSNLSEKIRALRQAKGWSQIQAARNCGINASIWSRIESGTIPTTATLKKIADGLAVSLNELLSSIDAPPELRIGFAHCIWAAPIIPLVMEGPTLPGIKLTSYGDLQSVGSYAYNPHWYDNIEKPAYHTGPSLVPAPSGSELPPGYRQWELQEKKSTYSAPDLDWLLTNKRIDCVIAARHVFSELDPRVMRCARIMDCVGSGSQILIWKTNGAFSAISDLHDPLQQDTVMLSQLADRLRNGPPLPTFCVPGTSSERAFHYFREASDLFRRIPIQLRDWDGVIKQMDTILEDAGGFLFLAWDPFISCIRRKYSQTGPSSTLSITSRLHLSLEKPLPYLSFDVMFGTLNAHAWLRGTLIQDFLAQVGKNIRALNEAINAQQKEARIVSQIASYLSMTRDDCLSALSRLDFGLLYYPEWVAPRTE